jgi:hypothetical protein
LYVEFLHIGSSYIKYRRKPHLFAIIYVAVYNRLIIVFSKKNPESAHPEPGRRVSAYGSLRRAQGKLSSP